MEPEIIYKIQFALKNVSHFKWCHYLQVNSNFLNWFPLCTPFSSFDCTTKSVLLRVQEVPKYLLI